MEPAISVRELRKTYGAVTALDGVSFDVAAGEIFAIIGRNGSGKTTCVETCQGLRQPDGGSIRVLGLDPRSQRRKLRELVGAQLQDSALPDRIKVWEALDLFAAMVHRSADWRLLMDQWGLSEKRNAPFGALSGGQRQRLLVALALVNNPRLVFLDEMTTGLDPASRRVAWELVAEIRQRGTTVVLVTHFMDEAERLADRVAILDRGKILAIDTPRRLVATYAGEVTVTFSTDGGDLSWLEKVSQVREVTRSGERVQVRGTGAVLALVASALVNRGILPEDLRAEQASLEDVFLALTGVQETED